MYKGQYLTLIHRQPTTKIRHGQGQNGVNSGVALILKQTRHGVSYFVEQKVVFTLGWSYYTITGVVLKPGFNSTYVAVQVASTSLYIWVWTIFVMYLINTLNLNLLSREGLLVQYAVYILRSSLTCSWPFSSPSSPWRTRSVSPSGRVAVITSAGTPEMERAMRYQSCYKKRSSFFLQISSRCWKNRHWENS